MILFHRNYPLRESEPETPGGPPQVPDPLLESPHATERENVETPSAPAASAETADRRVSPDASHRDEAETPWTPASGERRTTERRKAPVVVSPAEAAKPDPFWQIPQAIFS